MDKAAKPETCNGANAVSENSAPGRSSGNMGFTHSLEGRKERRLLIAIVVRLAQARAAPSGIEERTYTENVSAHGACVMSKRPWQTGEEAKVTSLKDGIPLCGKVVHCERIEDDKFYVGLNFQEQQVTWSSFSRYDGA